MKRIALTIIAACLSGAAGATPLASLSAQQVLEQFNLVALDDVNSTNVGQQHVDGRSYIGGNLTGSVSPWGGDPQAVYAAKHEAMSASSYAGLTVRGSVSNIQANNNGIVVGGNLTGSIVQNHNQAYPATAAVLGNSTGNSYNVATYIEGSSNDRYKNAGSLASRPATVDVADSTSAFRETLERLSSTLAQLSVTQGSDGETSQASKGKPDYPTTIFHAVANDGIAVFKLTAAALDTNQFEFDYGDAKTVIINVEGLDIDIGANFVGKDISYKLAENTIWNFYNATSVDITGNSFGGTILAPYAHLTNGNANGGGTIDGSVLVKSLTQNGEIHTNHFSGDISTLSDTPSTVPEPETLPLLLGGLALVAGFARRRRA